jgi:hypothetical protein
MLSKSYLGAPTHHVFQLSRCSAGSPAMDYARPYLIIRAFAFLPSLVSVVGFSAFRGT